MCGPWVAAILGLFHHCDCVYKSAMSPNNDPHWRWRLELKLRETNGNAFQSFFSDVMEARHGSDFVRIKPYGSLGDSGCDGYLASTGEVFACYGAQNGSADKVSTLISKMAVDFGKAKDKLASIMTHWHMTHNIIDGMPIEAVQALKSLEQANPTIEFSFFAPPRFAETIGSLSEDKRIALLGPAARNRDFQNLQVSEVRELVDGVMKSVEGAPIPEAVITPVSRYKLAFNDLPGSWASAIQAGRINGHHIAAYFQNHPDPVRGESVAQIFRERYAALRVQQLSPGYIMAELYTLIAGPGEVSIDRQVAAHSILSHLFESCDIFENAPLTDQSS